MEKTKKLIGFSGLMIVNFMVMFLIAGVGVYGYTVAENFNSISSVGMIFALECMARSVAIPLGGKIGDKIGHKKLFLGALGAYIISYGVVSTARSFWIFTAARMVSGFAWGLFMMNVFVLITGIFGQSEAPKYSGYNQSLTVVAMILAAPITGAICAWNWRMEFYIGIAILVLGFVMCAYGLPDIKPTAQKGIKLDAAGVAVTAVTLVAFTMAMNFGGTWGWSSVPVLLTLAAAVIGIIVLIFVEKRAEDPVFPFMLLKNKYYLSILMLAFVFSIVNGASSYAPTYAQYSLGTDSIIAGLINVPGMIVATVLSAYFGNKVSKNGKYKPMIMVWGIGSVVGGAIWIFLGGAQSAATGLVILFAGAFAIAAVNSVSQIAPYTYPMTILEPKNLASGLAFMGLAGAVGSTLSGGICNALMNSRFGLLSVFWMPAACAVIMIIYALKFKDLN